jgi:hypothetical protein
LKTDERDRLPAYLLNTGKPIARDAPTMRGMAGRMSRVLVALAMAGAAMTGCTSDRAPGCVSPSNEAGLLDEFAREAVLAVGPSGSKRREESRRHVACRLRHETGEVSITSVGVQYDLDRDVSRDEVRTLYEPVATRAGWTPFPSRGGEVFFYCRSMLGHSSVLMIHWQDAIMLDSGERIPGVITISIRLAESGQTEIEEQRRAAGCQP